MSIECPACFGNGYHNGGFTKRDQDQHCLACSGTKYVTEEELEYANAVVKERDSAWEGEEE